MEMEHLALMPLTVGPTICHKHSEQVSTLQFLDLLQIFSHSVSHQLSKETKWQIQYQAISDQELEQQIIDQEDAEVKMEEIDQLQEEYH